MEFQRSFASLFSLKLSLSFLHFTHIGWWWDDCGGGPVFDIALGVEWNRLRKEEGMSVRLDEGRSRKGTTKNWTWNWSFHLLNLTWPDLGPDCNRRLHNSLWLCVRFWNKSNLENNNFESIKWKNGGKQQKTPEATTTRWGNSRCPYNNSSAPSPYHISSVTRVPTPRIRPPAPPQKPMHGESEKVK